MTQLGQPIPKEVNEISSRLSKILTSKDITTIDANTVITGRDFLLKIWQILLGVPLGIAIISSDMGPQTFANIFYEIGLMQAYGKETLVIKTTNTKVPSDFIRTEYIEFTKDFDQKMENYLDSFFKQAEYYEAMADLLERNPLLAIDYLKRAYLISGNDAYREKAREIFAEASIQDRARNSVEMLLVEFCGAI